MKKNIWKRTMQVLGFGIICIMALFSYKGNNSHKMTFTPTLNESALGKCGEKPNCISSFHPESSSHFMPSYKTSENPIENVDGFFKDCKKVISKEHYRHYECTSKFFRFVDDVEVLFLSEKNELHFRSASRVGHSDLGANKKRIEALLSHLK
jgi:uncharacterized protein (DUF1499 family)